GGIGTLNELTVAYELKPTVILEGSGGWSSRIREVAYGGKHLEEAKIAELHFAQTPQEAVDMAFALAAGADSGRDSAREYR
ncbi:MAG: TIGR00725 family protein, partial [Candidatus Limnocylindria bacterium]